VQAKLITYFFPIVQVKRKTLCSWAPFSLVQPEILPGDLTRPGGPEILQSIKELTAQVSSSFYLEILPVDLTRPGGPDLLLEDQGAHCSGKQLQGPFSLFQPEILPAW
jgi:hypothetical protein